MKRLVLLFSILFLLFAMGTTVFAEDISVEETLTNYKASFDMIWLILAAALVFLMQAGFAMVETGLTRAKNASNILMKNLMDFCVGAIAFWAVGWAIMYGASYAGDDGFKGFFLNYNTKMYDMPSIFRDWMFQVVFAATAATIVSGAMAERTKFSAYLVYSVFISALIYPLFGSFTWGGGFLAKAGFHDFAGSSIVHSIGGWAGLAGAIVLGARKGKYIKDVNGKVTVKAIQGHNMPLAALGVFLLWFGWYGFNPGSTLSGTDLNIARVALTTTLGAAAGATLAMFTSWIMFKKPDPSMSLNGALAGLVAITAPCGVTSSLDAIIIGAIAGVLVVLSVEFIDKVLHIDDPVGAVSVHGVCGLWGTLAVGIFGDPEAIGSGLTNAKQFLVQLGGAGVAFAVSFGGAMVLFLIIKFTMGLRVSAKEELRGLDISEHGAESYSGFQIFSNM
ncbi:MAG: ammonium transporter [Spirochaetales bacterium]|nr:ammonium transporter [Spirochaetales bacterium]